MSKSCPSCGGPSLDGHVCARCARKAYGGARQHRFGQGQSASAGPDLHYLDGVVHPRIVRAMHAADAALRRAGVPHALVGGLAVGVHGAPRATRDVDFLVGEEAFEHHGGGLVTVRAGVPVAFEGVAVDPLSIGAGEKFLRRTMEKAPVVGGVPVLPIAALVYLKLKSPRGKDRGDIEEMIKAGAVDAAATRAYLKRAPVALRRKFDAILASVERE